MRPTSPESPAGVADRGEVELGRPSVLPTPGEVAASWRAMATEVVVRVPGGEGNPLLAEAMREARRVFEDVERACTRFDPSSPLMRANATPERWHRVPRVCFEAIREAHAAHVRTRGVFDPRVLTDLERLGYDRSLPFDKGAVALRGGRLPAARRSVRPWRPGFRGATREVLIGDRPIDLGGIGKGLAVRWASRRLAEVALDHYMEAGGDCMCAGVSGEGSPWRIAVEDPAGGGHDPVAVLALSGLACTTSSTRVRNWKVGATTVHHILDASTGRPGGKGLAAVTVVGRDPATSEVWSKTLFLAGADRIGETARRRGIPAVWVTTAGALGVSPAAERHLIWKR